MPESRKSSHISLALQYALELALLRQLWLLVSPTQLVGNVGSVQLLWDVWRPANKMLYSTSLLVKEATGLVYLYGTSFTFLCEL